MDKQPEDSDAIQPLVTKSPNQGSDFTTLPFSKGNGSCPLESLIPLISARIINASAQDLDEAIILSLQEINQSLTMDRGGLLKICQDSPCKAHVIYAWYDEGVDVVSGELDLAQLFPWQYQQVIFLGRTIALPRVTLLPAEAATDLHTWEQMGVQSVLLIPVFIGHNVPYVLTLQSLRKEYVWKESMIPPLRILGEILVSALERRKVQVRLDLAMNSAGIGLWELELASGNIWLSDKTRDLFHLPQEGYVTLTDLLAKVHPEDRSMVAKAIEKGKGDDEESQLEYRILDPAGNIRWLAWRGCTQLARKGKPERVAGVIVEITRRKHMEEKLQDQLQEINKLQRQLVQENAFLRQEAGFFENKQALLGNSLVMQNIKNLVTHVARTDSTVLIEGETGTGKELVAQAIHQASGRHNRLMITVNCAALPSALIESELFGREKGAFTGALNRQIGRFELANDSTLFLDEITEMPLETQAKLLRVLQSGTFERLGSPHNIRVNVRIIAATNRNLAEEVEQGRFRRDLFYRINVFPIHVPPLRERTEEIPELVWKFIHEFGVTMGRKIHNISSQDMHMLTAYSWPGNVRELRNVIERAMIISTGNTLELSQVFRTERLEKSPTLTIEEIERAHIEAVLKRTKGKIKGANGAAQLLGLNPSTLYSRMRKLNITAKPS